MAMITEDYVSFETAKLLKDKGFNEELRHMWYNIRKDVDYYLSSVGVKNHLPAPTHQMAMKWLREVHKIDICAFPEHYDYILWGYTCKIYKNKEQICCSKNFKLYKEAVEAAIKYCLEHLI